MANEKHWPIACLREVIYSLIKKGSWISLVFHEPSAVFVAKFRFFRTLHGESSVCSWSAWTIDRARNNKPMLMFYVTRFGNRSCIAQPSENGDIIRYVMKIISPSSVITIPREENGVYFEGRTFNYLSG